MSKVNKKSTNNIFKKGRLLDEFGLITFIPTLCSFIVFVGTLFFYPFKLQIIALFISLGFGVGFLLNRLKFNKATRLYMTLYPPTIFMFIILLIGGFFSQAVGFATMAFLAFIGYRRNPKLRIVIITYDILAFIIPTVYIQIHEPLLGVINIPYDEILVFIACLAWLSLTFRMYDETKTRKYTNTLEKNNRALLESESNLKKAQIDLKNQNNKLAVLNHELKLKNKHIEEFTFILTHDLKGPLNNINIIAKELQNQHSSASYTNFDNFLKHLDGSSARLTNLVQGLLKYAEIGSSSQMETININEVINFVLEDLSEKIKESNAEIIAEDMPVLIGRSNDLRMLFQNLIHNALKFKSLNKVPRITIRSVKVPGSFQFSVEDNGIGIPKNQQDNIFNAFHKLHNQAKFEGSGIGLYGSKKIINHHQGQIWVESEEQKGSKFHFTISTNLIQHNTVEEPLKF
ncbi:ATP-binding protein [uncultured Maribacter sp.]|uniref:sensor histidine kinase n=1 Tax=uncultured Maribacter sp. TaxID=431308 RepID=UPI0030D9C013